MTGAEGEMRLRILQAAVPLFARHGFSGVSMRQLAGAVGISAAAIYHHFPDKHALHLAAVAHGCTDRMTHCRQAMAAEAPPVARLEAFLHHFCQVVAADPDFRVMVQRELLDGDPERWSRLADQVFRGHFQEVVALVAAWRPDRDAHLTAVSLFSLVLYHFMTAPLRGFLPGHLPEHERPEVVADHVLRLLVGDPPEGPRSF